MNFKDKVKLYLGINEEMADKAGADLMVLLKSLKGKNIKDFEISKLQNIRATLHQKANEVAKNNAYSQPVAQARKLVASIDDYVNNQKKSEGDDW